MKKNTGSKKYKDIKQRLVKVTTMAHIIDMPAYSLRKMIREGKIPAYRIDGKNYIMDPEIVINIIKNYACR